MWFNVLKTQQTITDIGIDFELPEKVEPKKDDKDCCEIAKEKYISGQAEYLDFLLKDETYPDEVFSTIEREKEWILETDCPTVSEDIFVNIGASSNRQKRIENRDVNFDPEYELSIFGLTKEQVIHKLGERITKLRAILKEWGDCEGREDGNEMV